MDDRQRPSRRTALLPDPASTLLEPPDAPPDAGDPPPEPETSEALSRAAREAVRRPSTAEFLDALHACRSIGITVDGPRWAKIEEMVLMKRQQPD